MNTIELKQQINTALSDLSEAVKLFDQENLNKIPFKDSWTGGQLVQHLILSNGGFADVMNGPTKPTTRRFDEMVEGIKNSFLNFNIKMKSPEFIVPEYKEYEKDAELNTLDQIKTKVNRVIDETDLTQTCTSFEVPVLGQLTRWECLHFILYHTQRHIRQLKNIFQNVPK
jgi:hypothetical protein